MYYIVKMVFVINVIVRDVQGIKLFSFHNNRNRLFKHRSWTAEINEHILKGSINQKLDHFDAQETRTWKMRYFKRLEFWAKNGPIYLFIGGEYTAHPGHIYKGLIPEMAKETNGALFLSEHRYYGKSQPLKERSLKAMKYLTTPQALADNAKLLRKIKSHPDFRQSKIVVIGGSYAGNLAAWMKLIYPNLIDAAIASSAPILAKRDFYEALEIISNDFKKYGTTDCLENIRSIFHRYDTLFQTKKGLRKLRKEENICEGVNLTTPENKVVFFFNKINPFASVAQYGNIFDIKDYCNKINETKTVTNDIDYGTNKGNCNAYDFDIMIQSIRRDKNTFSWIYQTCTEYGYFYSTTSDNHPFTKNIPVEFYDKICTALYGDSFDKQRVIEGTRNINQLYGGRSPNVTEVIFVNGELDPWSSLSVLKDISPKTPAVYIPKASHCNELMVVEGNEPQEINKARTYIKYLIRKWIADSKPSSFKFNITITICKHCIT